MKILNKDGSKTLFEFMAIDGGVNSGGSITDNMLPPGDYVVVLQNTDFSRGMAMNANAYIQATYQKVDVKFKKKCIAMFCP